ncbi:MAG: HAMP domain-containing protein [candidate division Zixibacteria bacterium]|nr:HAMP domain-containing protein [candidate division Zixibacteria bacterium]
MSSVFGKRIFRLLLVFALVPSVLLTVTGYYIATETAEMTSAATSDHFLNLVDYFERQTTTLIGTDIDVLIDDSSASTSFVNFVLLTRSGTCIQIAGDSLLAPDVIAQVSEAVNRRPDGFVEVDSLVLQYSSREISDSEVILAGVVYGQEYSAMMDSYRSDRIRQLSRERLFGRYLGFLALLFAGLVLVAAGLAYYLSRRVSESLSRPVAQLALASEAIAGGDFNQKVTTHATGELRTLVESFNHMAAQLETTTAQLAQSERVAAWRHVARRFAHELKNPLQPIMISLYQIEKALSDKSAYDAVKEPLGAVADDIKHLTRLAERFSALAKLPPPKIEETDLVELLRSVTELYREQLTEYDLELELPAPPVHVELDPTYFREALHNLLKNAREATPVGGRIELCLREEDDLVRVVVRDYGCGMTENVKGTARIPYFTTKSTGSGLGLAIVERTVSELSGCLDITSMPEEGTVVTMTIPKTQGGLDV